MAKMKLNPLIEEMYGKLGNLTVRRSAKGEAILAKSPVKSRVKPSAAQTAQRRRFKEAVAYAKHALADPESRAHYELEATRLNRSAYSIAVAGYFRITSFLPE